MVRTVAIGRLCWSHEADYYIETDDGGYWMLKLAPPMIDPVDRMMHMRVMVEGSSAGVPTIAVSSISEAE
jgi:hypothetical protein